MKAGEFIYGDLVKLFVALPLIGLVNIIQDTATSALWADLIPKEHRGKITGTKNFTILIAASTSMILGGLIYDNISHQLPLLIFWASTVPLFLLTLLFVKEPEEKEE